MKFLPALIDSTTSQDTSSVGQPRTVFVTPFGPETTEGASGTFTLSTGGFHGTVNGQDYDVVIKASPSTDARRLASIFMIAFMPNEALAEVTDELRSRFDFYLTSSTLPTAGTRVVHHVGKVKAVKSRPPLELGD